MQNISFLFFFLYFFVVVWINDRIFPLSLNEVWSKQEREKETDRQGSHDSNGKLVHQTSKSSSKASCLKSLHPSPPPPSPPNPLIFRERIVYLFRHSSSWNAMPWMTVLWLVAAGKWSLAVNSDMAAPPGSRAFYNLTNMFLQANRSTTNPIININKKAYAARFRIAVFFIFAYYP